jgi:hypothetical protein
MRQASTRSWLGSIVASAAIASSALASSVVVSSVGEGGSIPDGPCGDPLCDGGPLWNTVPTWPDFSSTATVPLRLDRVTAVHINGLLHLFRGDLHVYLENPAGVRFNIIARPGSLSPFTESGNYDFGNYTIVESGAPSLVNDSANLSGGTYSQYLGTGAWAWNCPDFPIANKPLHLISGSAGTWTLHFRDWVPEETGAFVNWSLEGENDGTTTSFCFGDGSTIPCPCANNGASGQGCANSFFGTGASLTRAGQASVSEDSLEFQALYLTSSVCVFFQGTAETPATVIDDGIGCVGGTLIRIGTKSVVSALAFYPGPSDAPISVKGSVNPLGATLFYQAYYRNSAPAFCPPATSNRTNGLIVTWVP